MSIESAQIVNSTTVRSIKGVDLVSSVNMPWLVLQEGVFTMSIKSHAAGEHVNNIVLTYESKDYEIASLSLNFNRLVGEHVNSSLNFNALTEDSSTFEVTNELLNSHYVDNSFIYHETDNIISDLNISNSRLNYQIGNISLLNGEFSQLQKSSSFNFGFVSAYTDCKIYRNGLVDGSWVFEHDEPFVQTTNFNHSRLNSFEICEFIIAEPDIPAFTEVQFEPVKPPSIIIPPVRSRYMITNTIRCYRTSDNLEIAIKEVNIAIDSDSIHWTFDMRLGSKIDLDRILNNEFTLILNDFEFRGYANTETSDFTFGKNSLSVSGLSLSIELTDPYAIEKSYSNATPSTWRQQLQREANSGGFTITYEDFYTDANLDWSLPASVFSYQSKTPAQAMLQLCSSIGAVLNCDMSERNMIVKPRFSIPLWYLNDSTEDVVIPTSLIKSMSESSTTNTSYDSAYLQGEQSGANCHVIINGQSGDSAIVVEPNPILTSNNACAERGISELSTSGTISSVQITIPVMPELPILQIGKKLLIKDDIDDFKYIITGISIAGFRSGNGAVIVNQTVSLLRRK